MMQSESVEGDMGEKGEVVLPFELDVGEDHDLLSLSEEMQHLLNPGVDICVSVYERISGHDRPFFMCAHASQIDTCLVNYGHTVEKNTLVKYVYTVHAFVILIV